MTSSQPQISIASSISKRASMGLLVLAISTSLAGAMATTAYATTTTKPTATATAIAKPPATAGTPACQKVYKEVINADNVYLALQYGIVSAAKIYLAAGSLVNKLAYNESFAEVFKAQNAELNLAVKNPKCYPVSSIKGYLANIKSATTQIATIQSYIINGQIYYDPKKATALKPSGLLK